MKCFIFISRIFGNSDYPNLKKSFENVSDRIQNNIQAPYSDYGDYFLINNVEIKIMLIDGGEFKDKIIDDQDYLVEISNKSYESLINGIKKVFDEKIKESNAALKSLEFESTFPYKDTIICIHWGGEEGAKKDFDLKKSQLDYTNEIYKVTYFSSQEQPEYNYLKSGNEELIKKALKYYNKKVSNQYN